MRSYLFLCPHVGEMGLQQRGTKCQTLHLEYVLCKAEHILTGNTCHQQDHAGSVSFELAPYYIALS